jgi:hypothetical protein
VKERQPDEVIRRRRLGLTALSSPARVGFYSVVGIPLADSLIQSGPGSFTPRVYLPGGVRCAAGRGDDADRHDGQPDSFGG